MEIKYKKKLLKWDLISGVAYLFLGVIILIVSDADFLKGFTLGLIFFGFTGLISYYMKTKNPYLSITEEFIIRHSFPSKKVSIKDITAIRPFVSTYKIESNTSTLTIRKELMEPESLESLKEKLKNIKNQIYFKESQLSESAQ